MLRVQIPAKVILFGEWAVLEGRTCIGMPLRSQFELEATRAPQNILITKNEDLLAQKNLLETDAWAAAVWATLNQWLPLTEPYEMVTERAWPLHEGLGSSSALFLALLEMREQISGRKLPWPDVLKIFKSIAGNLGSGMDVAIQRARGAIVYRDFVPTPLKLTWPSSLVLLHGKRKTSSADAIRRTTLRPKQLEAIAQSAEKFLRSSFNDQDWIRAMQEHCQVLSEMNVLPTEAFRLQNEIGPALGLRSLKSVGAGGMDGLLIWVDNPLKVPACLPQLHDLGWYLSPHGASHD